MNECLEHWEQLRAAISTRGLDQFISKDGAEAMKRFIGDEKELRLETFDPLLSASSLIFNVAMQRAGLAMMNHDPRTGKPHCPLCFCAGPKFAANWIEGAADEVAKMVERLKKGPVAINPDGTVSPE